MNEISYRTDGPWGPGKGSNLAAAEVDQNFYGLDQRTTAIEQNPPQPISIDHFVVEGTLLTIVLTDGSEHGPFVLPIGQWRWTGPWAPMTQYFVGDLFTESGALYFTRVQHVSEATFDPGLFGTEGEVYVLILPAPTTPYDIAFYFRDRVLSGSEAIGEHIVARGVQIPADFAGAVAKLNVAPTSTAINLPIYKNAVQVGALAFAVGAQAGIFSAVTPGEPIDLAIGDTIDVRLPPENDTAAKGLVLTIPATVTSPPASPASPASP